VQQGYLFDSKDRRADREDRAVVFVSDSDFEGKEVLWGRSVAATPPRFEGRHAVRILSDSAKGGFNLYFQIGVFPGAVLAVKSERAHP